MSKKLPNPKRTYLTGHDQLCGMLLSAIDDCDSYDAGKMQKYRDRARQILQSPTAFDGGTTTLSVVDIIVNDELRKNHSQTSSQREYQELVGQVFDGDEREMVTGSALQLRGMGYRAISEATLYGAALMFELLKGGAR